MLQQLITYADSRIDGFFSDKCILILHGSSLDYYSEAGIKIVMSIQKVASKQQVQAKLIQMLEKHNTYTDVPIYFNQMVEEKDYISKMKKIRDCIWGNIVQNTETGYKLFSLDRLACVEVLKCMMLVKVTYLQEVKDRSLVEKVRKQQNTTKNLFNKYNLQYQQYPETSKTITVAYHYLKEQKIFLISKVPDRWQYPLIKIWSYLIDNRIVQKPVIQPLIMKKQNSTTFPTPIFLQQIKQSVLPIINVPVFRYPRHQANVSLMMTFNQGEKVGWIADKQAVCRDGKMYWISSYESLHLKFSNSIESQKIYNANALPLIVRANGYQSKVKDFLVAVSNASFHSPLASLEAKTFSTESTTSKQVQQLNRFNSEFGIFVVFSNHTVTGRFNDGIFIIANYLKNSARIADRDGNCLDTITNDQFYKEYLKHMYEVYQLTYYPREYRKSTSFLRKSSAIANINKSMLQYFESGDHTRCTYSESTSRQYDIDEIQRKNIQLLAKINKLKE